MAALVMGSVAVILVELDRSTTASETSPALSPPAERVRVEVLNAGGLDGAARDATIRLREAGFDVVHFGNADAFDHDTSVVIDRMRRPDLAQAVANALGIPNVLSQPDSNLYLEVSVLLGRDWSAAPAPASVADTSGRAWWDARRWIAR